MILLKSDILALVLDVERWRLRGCNHPNVFQIDVNVAGNDEK
jgi:hypothetical protein